ncbi:unnamed protein product [Chrysoparadoxa australica]
MERNNVEGLRREFLSHGRDVMCSLRTSSGLSLVHLAAMYGQPDMMNFLKECDLDVMNDRVTSSGDTCAHVAAYHGHTNILQLLWELGGSESLSLANDTGQLPAHKAVVQRREATLKWLHEHDAEVLRPDKSGASVEDMVKDMEVLLTVSPLFHVVLAIKNPPQPEVDEDEDQDVPELPPEDAEAQPPEGSIVSGPSVEVDITDLGTCVQLFLQEEIPAKKLYEALQHAYGSSIHSVWSHIMASIPSSKQHLKTSLEEHRKKSRRRDAKVKSAARKKIEMNREQRRRKQEKHPSRELDKEIEQGAMGTASLRVTTHQFLRGLIEAKAYHVFLRQEYGQDGLKSGMTRILQSLPPDKALELSGVDKGWRRELRSNKKKRKKAEMKAAAKRAREHEDESVGSMSSMSTLAGQGPDLTKALEDFAEGRTSAHALYHKVLKPAFKQQTGSVIPQILQSLDKAKAKELEDVRRRDARGKKRRDVVVEEAEDKGDQGVIKQKFNPFASNKAGGWSSQKEIGVVAQSDEKAEQERLKALKEQSKGKKGNQKKDAGKVDSVKLALKYSEGEIAVTELFGELQAALGDKKLKQTMPALLKLMPEEKARGFKEFAEAAAGTAGEAATKRKKAKDEAATAEERAKEEGERAAADAHAAKEAAKAAAKAAKKAEKEQQKKLKAEAKDRRYEMTQDEREHYWEVFEKLDKDSSGKISGKEAVPLMGKSGLDQKQLAKVWRLADQDKCGELDRREWAIAMHLIKCKTEKELMIPKSLPICLGGAEKPKVEKAPDQKKERRDSDGSAMSTASAKGSKGKAQPPKMDPYVMTPSEKGTYDMLFAKLKRDKKKKSKALKAAALKELTRKKGGYPKEDALHVYSLVDPHGTNMLDSLQWATLVHILACCATKGLELPTTIPKILAAELDKRPQEARYDLKEGTAFYKKGKITAETYYMECLRPTYPGSLTKELPRLLQGFNNKKASDLQEVVLRLRDPKAFAEMEKRLKLPPAPDIKGETKQYTKDKLSPEGYWSVLEAKFGDRLPDALPEVLKSLPKKKAEALQQHIDANTAVNEQGSMPESGEAGKQLAPDVKGATLLFKSGELNGNDYYHKVLSTAFPGAELDAMLPKLYGTLPVGKAAEIEAIAEGCNEEEVAERVLQAEQKEQEAKDEEEALREVEAKRRQAEEDGEVDDPWVVSIEDNKVYDKAFVKLDKNKDGFVTREEIAPLLKASNLDPSNAEQIFLLSDVDKKGALDRPAFARAYHLIRCVTKRDLQVPAKLPKALEPK